MEKSVFTAEYGVFLRFLRETRQASGLTQAQLAERLEETQSWISKVERGEHRLDVVELRKFCIALGMSITTFVERLEKELASVSGVR